MHPRCSRGLIVLTFALVMLATWVTPVFGAPRDVLVGQRVIPYVIVHDEHNGKNHPGGGPGGGGGGGGDVDHSGHYVLLPGQRQNQNVHYVVDDSGRPGALAEIEAAFEAWDAASGITFTLDDTAEVGPNVEVGGPNGTNTVSWALLVGSWTKALAVTVLWIEDGNENGTWDAGEPIVESDLLFNSKYSWVIDPDGEGPQKPAVHGKWFDIRNVATHEAGHFVGLDDQTQWDDETMFASASSGETKKISLEPGDIAGAQVLYGA